jgi:hypothetical protein
MVDWRHSGVCAGGTFVLNALKDQSVIARHGGSHGLATMGRIPGPTIKNRSVSPGVDE